MTIIEELEKACKETADSATELIKGHKAYTRTNASGTVSNIAEKDAPPQADSNRHKWDSLPDEEHPRTAMSGMSSKTIGNIARGKTDIQSRAKEELAARGVNEKGKWLGFEAAEAHHGVKVSQKSDEIDGHLQTLHHKVLGAIATGHTDARKLAGEELANRGHDHDGKWIGFDKADKLHGTK